MILKNFVVFEGCDGAGTTTQRQILCKKLINTGIDGKKILVFDTFEPTTSPIGRQIREILGDFLQVSAETLAFLFAADRNEHIFGKNGIAEHCARGEITVCDRYVLSSLVYQGIECGDELPARLNESFPAPQLLLFFDIDPQIAFDRMAARGQKEIYEYLEFQQKARARYKSLLSRCEAQGSIVNVIDASASVEEVAAQVWIAVENLPILKGSGV